MFAAMSVRKILLSVICLSCFLSAHAGQRADSVRIYYRTGYRYVEPLYRDNGMQLARFTESVRRALRDRTIECIVVRSGASPDGANRANELLSERRADSLVSYIVRHTDVPASLIDRQAAGIAWDELRAQVAASGMPYRDEVLDVLDNTPVWIFDERNRVVGGRKQRLMDLRGGEPYRYMLREFFPDLRSSVVVTLYFRSEETLESTQPPAVAPPPAEEPAGEWSSESEPATAIVPEPEQPVVTERQVVRALQGALDNPVRPRCRWAVKTNVAYLAATVANLGVEYSFGRHYSVDLPVIYSPYTVARSYRLRFLAVQPEFRYWLGSPMRGHFFGAHLNIGAFNISVDKKNRYQSPDGFYGVGLSYGYALPFARHWGAEFTVGAGYVHTKYDTYYNIPNGARYEKGTPYNYWGLTKVGVNLVYRFGK